MILASLLVAAVVGGISPNEPGGLPMLLTAQAKQDPSATIENMTVVEGIEAT